MSTHTHTSLFFRHAHTRAHTRARTHTQSTFKAGSDTGRFHLSLCVCVRSIYLRTQLGPITRFCKLPVLSGGIPNKLKHSLASVYKAASFLKTSVILRQLRNLKLTLNAVISEESRWNRPATIKRFLMLYYWLYCITVDIYGLCGIIPLISKLTGIGLLHSYLRGKTRSWACKVCFYPLTFRAPFYR